MSPWYKAPEKKPEAAAAAQNDSELASDEGEEKEKPKCDIGEQLQKAIDCREKQTPLTQKVCESYLRERCLCGGCKTCAQTDTEPDAKADGESEFLGCGSCGAVMPVALNHVGCCQKEEDKPLTQRVQESVDWRLRNWCTPWKGEEKKEEKKEGAAAQIDGDSEGAEGEEKPKCDIGEQIAKAIECKEKNKPLQQKVAESIQWHGCECSKCQNCFAELDTEASEGEEKPKCDIGEQVAKAIECKEKNKPLQQKVQESIQWHECECAKCGSCP